MMSEDFKNWAEPTYALYLVARNLGMLPEKEEPPGQHYRDFKWVWWSNNLYNRTLWHILEELVEMGFLEMGEDRSELHNHFRWVSGATFVPGRGLP